MAMAIVPGKPGKPVLGCLHSDFIGAKDDRGGGRYLGIGDVQSSSQIVITNKPTLSFFTGWLPFLSPNQQRQSIIRGKCITFHGLANRKLTRGSSNFVFDH